jgi:multiple sugar transport system permease protein
MKKEKAVIHLILIFGSLFMVFPFIWMILTALKTNSETLRIPAPFFPSHFQWHTFIAVFQVLPFGQMYMNSIVSTVVIIIGQLIFCSTCAYGFARFDFPFKNTLFILILSVLMIPIPVFLLPQYIIMQKLNLLNSVPALFLPGIFSAFGTFLMRQFFMSIPKEIEEAAIMDGCNYFTVFLKIALPLAKPALVSTSIFALLYGWNSLLWPLIVNTTQDKMTLTSGLATLNGQYTTNYPMLIAGSVLAIIPLILAFFIFQKQFIEGITLGGSKE